MPQYPQTNITRHSRGVSAALAAATMGVLIVAMVVWVPARANAAESPIGLGTAASYVVLGGQTVTNTGPSVLHGSLGVSPGSAITGFPPGIVSGATHAGDAAAGQAQSDLTIAYDDAAGRAPTASKAGDLVGQTLPGGVYHSTGPLALSGTLTLDGQHDPDSVFIFQIASTLITASASRVSLINGAQACHVFWQVGSSATLGTHSSFTGTILALTSITVTTGTVIHGRALARNGAVTLDDNTITRPTCTTPPPTTTTPPPTTTSRIRDSRHLRHHAATYDDHAATYDHHAATHDDGTDDDRDHDRASHDIYSGADDDHRPANNNDNNSERDWYWPLRQHRAEWWQRVVRPAWWSEAVASAHQLGLYGCEPYDGRVDRRRCAAADPGCSALPPWAKPANSQLRTATQLTE